MTPGTLHRAAPRWPVGAAGRLSGAGGRLAVRRGVSGFAVVFVRLFVYCLFVRTWPKIRHHKSFQIPGRVTSKTKFGIATPFSS